MRLRFLIACAAAAALSVPAAAQAPTGFVPLFTGSLDGWSIQNGGPENFSVADGVLRVQAPNGWLRSEKRYGDFSLRVEFRFVTPDADSGIFFRASGDMPFGRGWPNQSYQVQVRNPASESRFPPVGGLFRHGMPAGDMTFDPATASLVSTGTGEWQLLEIDVRGSDLVVRLNGTEVNRAGNIGNSPGYIGLQAETGTVEYRAIAIRETPAR